MESRVGYKSAKAIMVVRSVFGFIEWPEKIEDLLPGDVVEVAITENPDGSRTVEVK